MVKVLSKWYIYLISATVVVTGFCVGVSIKTTPKATERITFIVGSYGAKVSNINRKLKNLKPDSVKEVNCRYLQYGASNFSYLLSTLRSASDFYILPLSYIEKSPDDVTKYAANIKSEYVNEKVGKNLEYYENDGEIKGFKIYDAQANEGFLVDDITYTEEHDKSDYYLFFTYNSKNIGELNNSSSENAFLIVKELFTL